MLYGVYPYLMYVYTISIVQHTNSPRNKWFQLGMIPVVIYELLILGTYSIGFMKDRYMHDLVIILCFAVYAILITIVCHKHPSHIREKKYYILLMVAWMSVVSPVLLLLFPNLELTGIALSMLLLILYLYYQNRTIVVDYLLDIPNVRGFWRILDYMIGCQASMDILLVSIDDFKRVNEEFGHNNGNKLLLEVKKYLEAQAPKGMLFRNGGDEFTIILKKNSNISAMEFSDLVMERFTKKWVIGDVDCTLTACIAILEYPTAAETTDDIVSLLDYSMSYAKKHEKSQVVYADEGFKIKMYRRNQIISFLKKVVEESRMKVVYQPIYDVTNGTYQIAEALFRLEDEKLGNIPPYEFFPIAEEAGCVADIGYVLINKVGIYLEKLMEQGINAPVITVNFTRQQLLHEGALEKILQILKEHNVDPHNLAIEITPEVFSVHYHKVEKTMHQFAEKGIRFLLDGFGTEFPDMSKIFNLPFWIIKIDKRMMWQAEKDDTMYLLVSALTAVFAEKGILTLSEGIESEELKQISDLLFMDYLQGYYFAQPISGENACSYFIDKVEEK